MEYFEGAWSQVILIKDYIYSAWSQVLLIIVAIAAFFAYLKKIKSGVDVAREFLAAIFVGSGQEKDESHHWPEQLSASFTNERWELQEVLDIRRKYFVDYKKKDVLTEDDDYWTAFEKNKYAFSVVAENGFAFGYWGIIPVKKKDFFDFLSGTGKLSHSDMLTKAAISWKSADPEEFYLYHIGAVTLPVGTPKDHQGGLPLRAAKIELDNISVLYTLSQHAKIAGLAVYPSTKEGAIAISRHYEENGLTGTNAFADKGDRLTEIAYLKGENVEMFLNKLYEKYIKPNKSRSPKKVIKKMSKAFKRSLVGNKSHRRVPRRNNKETDNFISELQTKPKEM